jgi:hypothetical protein
MKRILSILLLALFAHKADATHLMGGDMVFHHDTAGYTLTLSLYRDIGGIPLGQTEIVDLYAYSASTTSYTLIQTFTIPRNMALSTLLLPNFPYGVEVGVYTQPFFGQLPTGQFRFVYSTCCRNGAILNAAQPLNESMILYTDVTIDTANNSTPAFLAMPVAFFPVNTPANYNPLPYDPDADSISWSLNTPIGMQNGGWSFTNVAGFTTPPADPSGPFTMNPVTGEITWTPDTVGNYIQSFEVKEYKNGVQVGSIIRDMQYVIVPGGNNSAPFFTPVTTYNTNTSQNYNYMYYFPGQQISFTIQGNDPENNPMNMTAFSPAFQMANPATFSTNSSGNIITGTFLWTPPANYANDVLAVFRLKDGQFTRDFTLLMKKSPFPASVPGVNGSLSNITVFPNPASNKLNVDLELNNSINAEVNLYSAIGQKVKSIYSGKLLKGNNRLTDDLNVVPGIYLLSVKEDGKIIKTVSIAVK